VRARLEQDDLDAASCELVCRKGTGDRSLFLISL
jgi:hypothetical protein